MMLMKNKCMSFLCKILRIDLILVYLPKETLNLQQRIDYKNSLL